MVREKDVRDAEIWPCSEGEGLDDSAKRSRSLRSDVDWRSAELKRAFYLVVLLGLCMENARLLGTNHGAWGCAVVARRAHWFVICALTKRRSEADGDGRIRVGKVVGFRVRVVGANLSRC